MSFQGVLARQGWSTDAAELPAGEWITARVALVSTQSIHVMLIRRPASGLTCSANWTEDGKLRVDHVPISDIAAWKDLDEKDNVTRHIPREQRRHLSDASEAPPEDDAPRAAVIPLRRRGPSLAVVVEAPPPPPPEPSVEKDPRVAAEDAAYAQRVRDRKLHTLPGVPDTRSQGIPPGFDAGFFQRPEHQ